MSKNPEADRLLARLTPFDQQHVLARWDELDEAGRSQLARQIDAIDLRLLAELFRGEVEQPDWNALARRATPPLAVRLPERASDGPTSLGFSSAEARAAGLAALRRGEIGVLLVAGGQGSRLGFDKPKSLYPIGPLSNKTLLELHVEKVRAVSARRGAVAPLYLMTSPITHEDTVEFLRRHDSLGLAADDLTVFCQGTMPALDAATGRLLMESPDSLFLSPDGHGGTVAALAKCGAIEHMHRRGVKHLFYFQVDNPLAPICDPEFVGCHLLAKSELTSLAVAKQTPQEKLGNFVTIDDRLHVIEYSDFPADVAERRDGAGGLAFWAGSVAIHMFDVAFLERSLSLKDSLPFHVAHKKAAYFDPSSGLTVEPSGPNAYKYERFIFDLLPHARRPILVEYAEEDSFAPLKNASGAPKDTPEYVQSFLLDQHRRWLEGAGAKVAEGVQVELSPLAVLDADDARRQIAPGRKFERSEYLAAE
jgi:UDP-N-acetylglucosamine/UDP-N-acetylgalactosamine diphosphorylase